MNPPKLSCYTYLFFATRNQFDLNSVVDNFTSFFDEVIIATIKADDDTYDRLKIWEDKFGTARFRVILTDIDIEKNNRFDGDLKTAAMKECSAGSIRVIADCDERFPLSQRPKWNDLAAQLIISTNIDGYLIPVVDLYGSETHIRATRAAGLKFRMHRDTIVRRGVPKFAEKAGGWIDTSQSDTTEPLTADGNLGHFTPIVNQSILQPNLTSLLADYPYVLHYGFVDLQRRAKLGKNFWKKHWEKRSGREENVVTEVYQFENEQLIRHSLPLV